MLIYPHSTSADPCGCQWQSQPRGGYARVSKCEGHASGTRADEVEVAMRDQIVQRHLDGELDHMVREHARGRRVEPAAALGPGFDPARRGSP